MSLGLAALSAKILIASYFIICGVMSVRSWHLLIGRITDKGLPCPALSLGAGLAVQLVAPLLLFAPTYSWIGAWLLIAFTVVATLLFHAYWKMEGLERFLHLNLLLANVAVMGGLLMLV